MNFNLTKSLKRDYKKTGQPKKLRTRKKSKFEKVKNFKKYSLKYIDIGVDEFQKISDRIYYLLEAANHSDLDLSTQLKKEVLKTKIDLEMIITDFSPEEERIEYKIKLASEYEEKKSNRDFKTVVKD